MSRWILFFLLFAGMVLMGCEQESQANTSSAYDWVQVSSGGAHTCGLHEDGSVECWGCEGDKDWNQCDVPDGKYIQVSAGMFHTCLISEDKQVVCFGCQGEYLSMDINADQCNPPNVERAVEVDSGYDFTTAIRIDGMAYCWGRCP